MKRKLPLYFQQPDDNMLQALHGHPGNTILPVLYWPSAADCKNKKWILQGHFKVGVPWVLIYVKFITFCFCTLKVAIFGSQMTLLAWQCNLFMLVFTEVGQFPKVYISRKCIFRQKENQIFGYPICTHKLCTNIALISQKLLM